jgi:hypothetical protein
MSFAPTIVFAGAQNVILGELPRDAKLVATVSKRPCEVTASSAGASRVRDNEEIPADSGAFRRWAVPGSNQRPPACKAGALPTELTALGV